MVNTRRFQIKMPPEGISLLSPKFAGKFSLSNSCAVFSCTIDSLQKILVKEIQVIVKKERFNSAESFHFVSLAPKRLLLQFSILISH